MNNESGKDGNDIAKEPSIEKEKNISNIIPNSEKEQPESHIKGSGINLQNSAFKNFKSEIRSEPANTFL